MRPFLMTHALLQRGNERGIALVIALAMLTLLGILGALVLSSSRTELSIVGNYRNQQEAFYLADAATDWAETNAAIYMAIMPGPPPNNSWPAGAGNMQPNVLPELATPPYGTADVRVEWLLSGPLPPGSGYSADAAAGYLAHYFMINTSAQLLQTNTIVQIDAQTARIVPK